MTVLPLAASSSLSSAFSSSPHLSPDDYTYITSDDGMKTRSSAATTRQHNFIHEMSRSQMGLAPIITQNSPTRSEDEQHTAKFNNDDNPEPTIYRYNLTNIS